MKIAGCSLCLCCWHLSASALSMANEIWRTACVQPGAHPWLAHGGITSCKLHCSLWPGIFHHFPKWLFTVPQLLIQVLFFVVLWLKQNVSGFSFICLLILRKLTEEEQQTSLCYHQGVQVVHGTLWISRKIVWSSCLCVNSLKLLIKFSLRCWQF